jgi:hypothetical protein
MSPRQHAAMAALAALSLWSLAFLFGTVAERMRAGCERSIGTTLTQETTALSQEMEVRR